MAGTGDWVAAPPPEFETDRIAALLARHWGLSGRLERLYAERDLNLRLTTGDGERWLVKISHPDTPPAALALEDRVLEHVAGKDPSLPVSRARPTRDGQRLLSLDAGGAMRVMDWLEGVIVDLAAAPAPSRNAMGVVLARLGLALRDCPAEGVRRDLAWDLQNFPALAPLLAAFPLPQFVPQLQGVLAEFGQGLGPGLSGLSRQLVHNDFNPDNVLFDPAEASRVTGVIDFGDLTEAPVVCDLAVACAYLVGESGPDPLSGVLDAVRGYHRVRPLTPAEQALLPGLVRVRLCTTLLVQGARIGGGQDPKGALAETVAQAGRRLLALDALGAGAAEDAVRRACAV